MGKKQPDLSPLGKVDELLTRIEKLEERLAAIEGATNAFIVVYGVRRLQPPADNSGDGEQHESTSRGE